jgi:hypothetical protein
MTAVPLAASILVLMHLGGLHAYEQLIVLAIAFGPFVVLGFVVHRQRRRDIAAERDSDPG